MMRWWEKYQAWKERRRLNALQKWSQERLEGKARYVLRTTLLISMTILTATEIFDRNIGVGTIIFWHAAGLGMGLYNWMDNETKYQLARSNGQLNFTPASVPPKRISRG